VVRGRSTSLYTEFDALNVSELAPEATARSVKGSSFGTGIVSIII
jgi:hypothetical protein